MTSPNNILEEAKKADNGLLHRILRLYAAFLVRYPTFVLATVVLVATLCGMFAFMPSLGAKDLPDFSNPLKGFISRGTTIASRRTTFKNLFDETLQQSSRRKRSLDLDIDLNNEIVLIYEHVSGGDLKSHMKSVCMLHQQIILNSSNAQTNLQPSSHHIPNYIAYLNDLSSCDNITIKDIDSFFELLQNCREYFINGMFENCRNDARYCASINSTCGTHPMIPDAQEMSRLFYNTFYYLIDSNFIENPDVLTFTSSINTVISLKGSFEPYFDPLYEQYFKDLSETRTSSVKIVAYHLKEYKYHILQKEIVTQAIYIFAGSMTLVIVFLWFYTGSKFGVLMTFVCVIMANVISYFIYSRVFNVNFFPFINIITIIFIVGIGADDVFVYITIWKTAQQLYVFERHASHAKYLIKWTIHSLRHALMSMFVTSLTTAAAFYANISSNVTAVKCFGLFSGTAIIVNYLLMVFFFPAVIIFHDKYFTKIMPCCYAEDYRTIATAVDSGQDALKQKHGTGSKLNIMIKRIETTKEKISNVIFKRYLPETVWKGRFIWITFCLTLGVAGIVVTFVKLDERPNAVLQEQLFTSSNSLEQYDLEYKQKFLFGTQSFGGNLDAGFAFGVKPVDNGNKFDPDDLGTLEYYNDILEMGDKQLWLRDLCVSIRNASFYVSSTSCDMVMEMFKTNVAPCILEGDICCNLTLPMPENDFNTCMKLFRPPNVLFDSNGNSKAFYLAMTTSYKYTDDFDENEKLFTDMNDWFDEHIQSVVSSTFQGFWYIDQTNYDLQTSLSEATKDSLAISIAVALAVIFFTTGNVVLSIYSILTIAFIMSTTVGIFILSGWRLNITESMMFSVAAGLSADFTLHYSMAYKTSSINYNREKKVRSAIIEIGPAVVMGTFTTFTAGAVMASSNILVFIQMAQFLMLLMFLSWFFGTFLFLSLCAVIGPVGNFGQLRCGTGCCRKNRKRDLPKSDNFESKCYSHENYGSELSGTKSTCHNSATHVQPTNEICLS